MFVSIALFFVGFYILTKGASFLIDGSIFVVKKLNIPNIVIGLVIIGIGTSLPEFAIFFTSNLVGESDIGLGTITGSNTFNMLFILGLTAIFFPLTMKISWITRDLLWNIIAIVVVIIFALTSFNGWVISRIEGLFLLLLFALWFRKILKDDDADIDSGENSRIVALPVAVLFIIGGLVGVFVGGKWVVDGAVVIARELGVTEALIGLLIVGPGTSLPELVATLTAAYRRQPGIAVGGIIGSNIFDFLAILGISALAKPIVFPGEMFLDISVTLISSIALFMWMFVGKKFTLSRWQGFFMVLGYFVYVVYLISRG